MKNSRFNITPLNILRFIAAAGTIFTIIYKILSVSEIRPNQYYSFYALLLIAFGVGISLFVLRNAFLTVLKNYDLLVPVALYISANALFGFFTETSTFIGFKNGTFNWAGLSAALVSFSLLQVLIGICFTGWMTRVILRFVQTEKVELFDSFKNIGWWFPRTLGVILFGWLPLFLIFLLFFPFMFSGGSFRGLSAVLLPFIIFISVFSLGWNLATSAVLPYVLWITTNLKQAVQEGIIISWKNRSKVFLPVVLLMFVCGWITFISVTYSAPKAEEKFGESPNYTTNLKSKFNYAANFVWIGGYPESSDWNKNMLKAVEEEPLSSVDFRIKLIVLFLSLVVNLHIIRVIFGVEKTGAEKILNFDQNALSNNRIIIPVLAAVAVLFPFEIFNPARPSSLFAESDASKFADKKIYTGENFFSKNEFFKIGQHQTYETNPKNIENFQLGSLTDISVLGNDASVVISGNHGALIFDKNGGLREKIKFDLDKEKTVSVDSFSKNVTTRSYFKNAKAVDMENDGNIEFAGIASDGNDYHKGIIFNNKGEIIREFEDGEKRFSIQDVNVKDVDGDGEKEIIVEYSGTLKFFDLKGEEKWSQDSSGGTLSQTSVFADIDGDGQDEILHANYMSGSVRNLKSDSAKKIERPYQQQGFLIEGVEKPSIVFLEKNKLGLFDFEGNLISQYPAPLSDIQEIPFLLKDKNYDRSYTKYVQSFRASAVKVKLKSDQPKYLAVLTRLAVKTGADFVDMLYIYDEDGNLVYQEATGGDDHRMEIMPLENGTEGLLIQEKDTVWLYKAI